MVGNWNTCFYCCDYAEKRREFVVGPLADKAILENRKPEEVVDEFMEKVHQRHLSGSALYPGGPVNSR